MGAPKGHPPYPGCETGGRPKKYTEPFLDKLADALVEWMRHPEHIWVQDFCLEQNVNPNIIPEWCAISKKFSMVYEVSKKRQESKLLNGGLFGKTNPGFTKFCLVNHHNYMDKQTILQQESSTSQAMKKADGESKDLIPQ